MSKPLREPRRRLTIEALGLIILGALIALVSVLVFVLIRATDDTDALSSGIEGLLSLGAVLAGAVAGWLGRSALGTDPADLTNDG